MKKNNPLISVLMPVYNAEAYVEAAIRSILVQTMGDFEFLIFDDGSCDNSVKIIENIIDERIVFFKHKKNMGLVSTLNEGLSLARGKYIARMDNDDISLPQRFAEQVIFMDGNPGIGVCGTAFTTFGDKEVTANMPVTDAEIREGMLLYNPLGHPTVMMRSSVVREYHLKYRQTDTPAEDYRMWYDFSKVTRLHNLAKVHLYYRVHPSQMSSSMSTLQKQKVDKIRILQLTDKGFNLSFEEQKLYCNILDADVSLSSYNAFVNVSTLINKIQIQNGQIKAFNTQLLNRVLSNRWIVLINSIEAYNPVYAFWFLVSPKVDSNVWSVIDKMKFFVKSMLFWKYSKDSD